MESNGRKQRVFIGVPCYGDVSPEILQDWMGWLYYCGKYMPQYEFCTGIKTKSEQFRARNALIEGAQQVGADWLLMIDDDMILNIEGNIGAAKAYDLVDRLVKHNKDICGVLYHQKAGECAPVLMKKRDEKGYRFLRPEEITHGLQRVDVAGGGCLLIRMSIFDKLKPPHFAPEFEYGTDVQLCKAATDKGFEVWADTSIELGHVRLSRDVVTSKNRQLFRTEDMIPGEVKSQFIGADMYESLVRDGEEYTGVNRADMWRMGSEFLRHWNDTVINDLDGWYSQFPKARVARQVAFNSEWPHKKQMTEFILCSITDKQKLNVLEYGAGIGLPAFELARRGHQVLAVDLLGTETIEFLKWRKKKHSVPMAIHKVRSTEVFCSPDTYDVIIAMDVLEHCANWRAVLDGLIRSLKPEGFIFANNAILEDNLHPEHLFVDPREFLKQCVEGGLMPINEITYKKKEMIGAHSN